MRLLASPELPGLTETVGAAGEPTASAARHIPLVHAGDLLATWTVVNRRTSILVPDDDAVLSSLAGQAAVAVFNARLSARLAGTVSEVRRQAVDLAASRERLVRAQDVERRRLERDLHDGAQQEIVAVLAKLQMARNRLRRGEADGVDSLLEEAKADVVDLLAELRELAHGIRPAVLADRGLVQAIEARAGRLPVPVTVDASAEVRARRYADQIEGAAWFALSEAIANALKHAGATELTVTLNAREGRLCLAVADDGHGFDPGTGTCTGLANLRDRLEALGGRLTVASRPGTGTTVNVDLPALSSPTAEVGA